jgi:uncharacterized membrane protein
MSKLDRNQVFWRIILKAILTILCLLFSLIFVPAFAEKKKKRLSRIQKILNAEAERIKKEREGGDYEVEDEESEEVSDEESEEEYEEE